MHSLRIFGLVAVVVAALHSSGSAQTNRMPLPSAATADQVVKALESCPAWSDVNADSNKMLATLKNLSTNDTPTLRVAIEKFVARCRSEQRYDIGNMSKLFVFNRLLFAVPEREKFSGPFFGGWEGVPHDKLEMNMLWPLSHGKDAELLLTGKYSGYSGDRYFAVQEFDHFLTKYGRRQTQQSGSPKSR